MATSSKSPPVSTALLSRLTEIESIADQGRAPPPPDRTRRDESSRPGPAPTATPADAPLYALLAELRADIRDLKAEQMQIAASAHEQQLVAMLNELRRDIDVLKHGHEPMAPTRAEAQQAMLSEMQLEMAALQNARALSSVYKAVPGQLPVIAMQQSRAWSMGQLFMIGLPIGLVVGLVATLLVLFLTGHLAITMR